MTNDFSGGLRGLRPPATFWQPSGLRWETNNWGQSDMKLRLTINDENLGGPSFVFNLEVYFQSRLAICAVLLANALFEGRYARHLCSKDEVLQICRPSGP